MEKLVQIIHDDIKEIKKDIREVKITNAVQNEQLAEHMRRTKNVEGRVEKLENYKWVITLITTVGAGVALVLGKVMGVY